MFIDTNACLHCIRKWILAHTIAHTHKHFRLLLYVCWIASVVTAQNAEQNHMCRTHTERKQTCKKSKKFLSTSRTNVGALIFNIVARLSNIIHNKLASILWSLLFNAQHSFMHVFFFCVCFLSNCLHHFVVLGVRSSVWE